MKGKYNMFTMFIFFLVLGVSICVHELGHFAVAKWIGVKVPTFSIGFGKSIIEKKIGDTTYKIGWIPLGGYVKLAGESPGSDPHLPKDKLFYAKNPWKKLAVIVAGPLMNLVCAVLALSFAFMIGFPQRAEFPKGNGGFIEEVRSGGPGDKAGIKAGDIIIKLNGSDVDDPMETVTIIGANINNTVELTLQRGDSTYNTTVSPQPSIIDPNIGVIGVAFTRELLVSKYGPLESLKVGFLKTIEISKVMVWGVSRIFTGDIPAKQAIGGPIQIAVMSGEFARAGVSMLLFFFAILNINLGILNLLPIPVLDGGHVAFISLEIIGFPVSPKVQGALTMVGMALLLLLMVFAVGFDISKYKHKFFGMFK